MHREVIPRFHGDLPVNNGIDCRPTVDHGVIDNTMTYPVGNQHTDS